MGSFRFWWRQPWLVVAGKKVTRTDTAVVSRMVPLRGYSSVHPIQVTKTTTEATAKAIAQASKRGVNSAARWTYSSDADVCLIANAAIFDIHVYGAVALSWSARWGAVVLGANAGGEFGEGVRDPVPRIDVGAKFVVVRWRVRQILALNPVEKTLAGMSPRGRPATPARSVRRRAKLGGCTASAVDRR
jgi:hypothetical protein